jgi:hypothetical protein
LLFIGSYLKEITAPTYFGWSYEDLLPNVGQIKSQVTFSQSYMTIFSDPL